VGRKNFSLHLDFFPELKKLPPERCGALVHAMIDWAQDNESAELDPECAMLFRLMTAQIERISATNSKNGSQGGAPVGNKNAKIPETTETSELSETTSDNRNKPTVPVTVPVPVPVPVPVTVPVTVTVPVPVTETVSEEKRTERAPARRFVAPTVEEVAKYCQERKNGIDAEKFVAYYASIGWLVGRNPMKDWQKAIITWERNNDQPRNSEFGNIFLDLARERGIVHDLR